MNTSQHTPSIYGPVYSRRLGRSLGVDLVPFKTCTYDCVYCQLGPTTDLTCERRAYVPLDRVIDELGEKLRGEHMGCDYIGLAGSGEPTLHAGLGGLITRIKAMTDVPVAILTNGALLHDPAVADALCAADLVLPSLDAGDAACFAKVNRPHPDIAFETMVGGLETFSKRYEGAMRLEVLLVSGVNDSEAQVARIAGLASRIAPTCVDLTTVARPAAMTGAAPVPAKRLAELRALFDVNTHIVVEQYAGEKSGAADTATDDDIRALLRRRPCTAHGVAAGLNIPPNEAIKRLQALLKAGELRLLTRDSAHFYAVNT